MLDDARFVGALEALHAEREAAQRQPGVPRDGEVAHLDLDVGRYRGPYRHGERCYPEVVELGGFHVAGPARSTRLGVASVTGRSVLRKQGGLLGSAGIKSRATGQESLKGARSMSTVGKAQDRKQQDWSIIALDKFIQATRDSGYKGTASAISELVDNSIQAGAKQIAISVATKAAVNDEDKTIEVSVLDNGCGMDPFTLRQALRFGGSTRFGDRQGLGRYGMGLPNASLSQARRVTVYTWQGGSAAGRGRRHTTAPVFSSYLDVDKIARGEMERCHGRRSSRHRPALASGVGDVRPLVTVRSARQSARVDDRPQARGRPRARFRQFIWRGLRITINGDTLEAFDPLYLHPRAKIAGASLFGDELRYEVRADPADPKKTGWVSVRFTELPVQAWHKLSNEEKHRMGVSKGAGVSIVRAGREVDYGWFFMGSKNRENYDDWWRCEIQFDPVLDEAFGITHTKQQARPQAHFIEALTPDIEAAARVLHGRARKAH